MSRIELEPLMTVTADASESGLVRDVISSHRFQDALARAKDDVRRLLLKAAMEEALKLVGDKGQKDAAVKVCNSLSFYHNASIKSQEELDRMFSESEKASAWLREASKRSLAAKRGWITRRRRYGIPEKEPKEV